MCSSVASGPNAVVSMIKSTPKGRDVSALTAWIITRVAGGGAGEAPNRPKPPALEIAATNGGSATKPMPAETNGNSKPYWSVNLVRNISVSFVETLPVQPPQ